jgi:hypothetical protein
MPAARSAGVLPRLSELLAVDVAAARRWEQDRRVDPWRHPVERVEHDLPKRHRADAPIGLAALFQRATREASPHVQDAADPVDVAAVETEQFFRSEAAADTDDRDGPVARVELVGEPHLAP